MGGGLSLFARNSPTAGTLNMGATVIEPQFPLTGEVIKTMYSQVSIRTHLALYYQEHITTVNPNGLSPSVQSVTEVENAHFSMDTPSGYLSTPGQNSARAEVNVSLAIAMTPRGDDNTTLDSPQCVPYTPHGDEATVFKYYCPLCMQYFKDIMKMKCCSNYMCAQCCKEYISTKGIKLPAAASISTLEERFINTNAVPCPHCQVSGFHPMSVSFEEIVRDYSSRYVPEHGQSSTAGYSPLRVGESFEDLKRKMIPYKNAVQLPSYPSHDEATPRDSENEVVSPYDARASPQRDVMGIAMINYVSSTPIMLSPRMQLEPTSPDFISSTADRQYVDRAMSAADSKGVEDGSYFQSDLSGVFESHRPPASEEKSQDRELLLLVPLFETESMMSPNEVRLGSPSPRVAESKKDLRTHSDDKPPTGGSRSHSCSGSGNGSRNGSRSGSFITTGAGMNTHSLSNRHVHLNIYASGVVDQMFRTALAQHTQTAQQ